MKTQMSMFLVLSSLLTFVAGGLAAQGGAMQIPPGMQMPTPEEMLKQLEANVKMMADQLIQQFDDDDDSALSFEEFTEMYDTMAAGTIMEEEETEEEKQERLKKEFEDADTDDDDSLSKDEVFAHGFKQAKADMSEATGIKFPEETEEDSDAGDKAEDEEGEAEEEEGEEEG